MKLVKLENSKIISNLTVNGLSEEEVLIRYPDYLRTDFNFVEDFDLYQYNGTSFDLISGWEDIKAQRAVEKTLVVFGASQAGKLKEIKQAFNTAANRPRVDSTLGYDVDGNKDDLYNFENALVLGVTEIRDADNAYQAVTNADLELIIQKIRVNGLGLFQKKWQLDQLTEAALTLEDLSDISW